MKKIAVALSGGVDSSVAASMLVERGFKVTGVYMKYASETTLHHVNTNACSWHEDMGYVKAVGSHLNIPITVLNVEREYDESVINPFLEECSRGRTPNPDVLCNRSVKFGVFFNWAHAVGFGKIATGHYARIVRNGDTLRLAMGLDTEKDQSYFLHSIDHGVLRDTFFPIGTMTKREVRTYARERGLPNADRPDSQGICFIGPLDVKEFIYSKLGKKPGCIQADDGTVLGYHDGLSYYTIGQRHGLGIGGGTPYYAAKKDLSTRTLTVAKGKDDPIINHSALIAEKCTWHTDPKKNSPFRCKVRIRYRQPLSSATVLFDGQRLYVNFDRPQHAITPGQSVVLYDNELVIGGGIIEYPLSTVPINTNSA